MSQNKHEIEVHGRTVDAAIEEGLAKLGVSRDAVTIKIEDEGSRGILGLGSRDAVVRLTLISDTSPGPVKPGGSAKPVGGPAKPVVPAKSETPTLPKKVEVAPAAIDEPVREKQPDQMMETAVTTAADVVEIDSSPEELTEAEMPSSEEAKVIADVVGTLIKKMDVKATINMKVSETDDLTGKRINIVDIRGDDLGVLIGPRGETLDSLQYISRLMVGHRMQQRSNFVVDVEGYRERRKQALARMADRMAQKVIERDRPVTLEPMPAYERRIIHMTLRDSDQVYTESVGEGSRRKVRIYPKK